MSSDTARASLSVIPVTTRTLVERGVPRRTALRIVTAAIESRAWEVTTVRVAIGKGARRAVDAVLVPPAVLEAAVAPWQTPAPV